MKLAKLLKCPKDAPFYYVPQFLEGVAKFDIHNLLLSLPHDCFYLETHGLKDLGVFIYVNNKVMEVVTQMQGYQVYLRVDLENVKAEQDGALMPIQSFCVLKGERDLEALRALPSMAEDQGKEVSETVELTLTIGVDNLAKFIELLRDKQTRMAKEQRAFKVGHKKYQTLDISYVTTLKYLQENDASKGIRHLEWGFSWIRRGHWRILDPEAIGKDRDGNRTQKGRTWVLEHTCKDELPLRMLPKIVR